MNKIDFGSEKQAAFSVVLVNYKTLEMTKICLDLLRQHLGNTGIPVWVVDNYSGDESTEYLRKLDWIKLVERTSQTPEAGHVAHGRALDMVLERVDTKYLFLLHTDTFVLDGDVFGMMIGKCANNAKVVAVGCVEQMNRGMVRTVWRSCSRFCKHYFRRLKLRCGLKSREPKPYRETYLKSFCTLWNVETIKKHGMHFLMDDRVPGYELQDRMTALGYELILLPPSKLFGYLDHIQAGTVAAAGGYGANHRRTVMYTKILERIDKDASKNPT